MKIKTLSILIYIVYVILIILDFKFVTITDEERILALKVLMCLNNLLYIFIVLFDEKYLFKSYYSYAGMPKSVFSLYKLEVQNLVMNKYYAIGMFLNIIFYTAIFEFSSTLSFLAIIFSSLVFLLLCTYLFVFMKYFIKQNIEKDNNLIMSFHFFLAIIMMENFFPIIKNYSILSPLIKVPYFYFFETYTYDISIYLIWFMSYFIILKIYVKWHQLSKHYI